MGGGLRGLKPTPPPPPIFCLSNIVYCGNSKFRNRNSELQIYYTLCMHGKINFSSAFMSSFQLVTCNRLSTYCYILQHYMLCKQWHNNRNLSCFSIGYFRSSKRPNIYDETVFFAYILYIFHSEAATVCYKERCS